MAKRSTEVLLTQLPWGIRTDNAIFHLQLTREFTGMWSATYINTHNHALLFAIDPKLDAALTQLDAEVQQFYPEVYDHHKKILEQHREAFSE